jgi:hypothetical protein
MVTKRRKGGRCCIDNGHERVGAALLGRSALLEGVEGVGVFEEELGLGAHHGSNDGARARGWGRGWGSGSTIGMRTHPSEGLPQNLPRHGTQAEGLPPGTVVPPLLLSVRCQASSEYGNG